MPEGNAEPFKPIKKYLQVAVLFLSFFRDHRFGGQHQACGRSGVLNGESHASTPIVRHQAIVAPESV